MPSTVLVGAQWGDEGKGKICDLVAGDFDAVVRYSGGNNAGHTIVERDAGALGDGAKVQRSSPTELPGAAAA